jgi:hypothetical protein
MNPTPDRVSQAIANLASRGLIVRCKECGFWICPAHFCERCVRLRVQGRPETIAKVAAYRKRRNAELDRRARELSS